MSWPWITVVCALSVLVLAQSLAIAGIISRATGVLAIAEAQLARYAAPPPAVGTSLPTVDLRDGDRPVPLRGYAGRPLVLIILSTTCPACVMLATALTTAPGLPSVPVLAIVDTDEHSTLLPSWITPLRDTDRAVSMALGVDRTPVAIAVDAEARVLKTLVPGGPEDILALADLAHHAIPAASR